MARKKIDMFVPAEEQPYSIAKNWKWVFFSAAIELISGRDAALVECNGEGKGIPYILGASNISDNHFIVERWIEKPQVVSKKGDILLSVKGTIGKLYLQQEENINISRQIMAIRPCLSALPQFVFLFISSVCDELREVGNGLIPGISRDDILYKPFPLPPLPEQHRIVNRIESLFAKLDEAKEKAQAVVDGFEDRKAAILHKAFTGELTAEWRKRNTEQKFRKKVTIREVCSSLAYGTASKSSKEGKVAVIRMGNLQGGEIDWDNLVYSNNDGDNVKYALSAGDVLFNRTNSAEHVGKTAIYRGERPAIYAGYLIKLDYDHSRIQGEYLNYLLNSPEAREYCKRVKTDAVNQSNINAQKIGAFEIPLVGMNEQEETCRLAKKMIGAEETIKDAAQNSIRQINTMKKAILARAFRGELGTNDPSEPPAEIGIS